MNILKTKKIKKIIGIVVLGAVCGIINGSANYLEAARMEIGIQTEPTEPIEESSSPEALPPPPPPPPPPPSPTELARQKLIETIDLFLTNGILIGSSQESFATMMKGFSKSFIKMKIDTSSREQLLLDVHENSRTWQNNVKEFQSYIRDTLDTSDQNLIRLRQELATLTSGNKTMSEELSTIQAMTTLKEFLDNRKQESEVQSVRDYNKYESDMSQRLSQIIRGQKEGNARLALYNNARSIVPTMIDSVGKYLVECLQNAPTVDVVTKMQAGRSQNIHQDKEIAGIFRLWRKLFSK